MDTTPNRSPAAKAPVMPEGGLKTPSGAFSAIKAKRIQLDQVMAGYDVTKISPRDIDAFVEDMLALGQPLNEDMLMLSSFGERFLDHLAKITGQSYNASVTVDLVEVATDQRGVAERAGDTTENWDQFLTFLTIIQDRAKAASVGDAAITDKN